MNAPASLADGRSGKRPSTPTGPGWTSAGRGHPARARRHANARVFSASRLLPLLAFGMAAMPAEALAEEARRWKAGLSYTTDLLANVAGGREEGAAWLGRADATLEVDGDAVGLAGATFFFDLVYTHGPDFSGRYVGDAQVVSNVQGDGILRPYEAHVTVPLAGGLSAKAGLVDLNTEFDVQTVGAFFTNSSHGIGVDFSQTGRNGPSIFPVPTTAAVLRWQGERARVGLGLFNAVAGDPDRPKRFRLAFPGEDGALLVAEAGVDITRSVRGQVGGWVYTAAQPRLDAPGRSVPESGGAYGQLELALAGDDEGGLDFWARAGMADPRTNRVTAYVGGGFVFGGDDRRVGFAVAHARQSDRAARFFAPEEGRQAGAETSFELGYAVRVGEALTVQPVAHYVINPGWRADLPDALVLGLRLSFAVEPWSAD